MPHTKGGTCPQLAIYAETQGRQIAKNVIATVDGKKCKSYRFTGLGDALIMLRLRYDTEEARRMAAKIAEFMRDRAYLASIELAKERGDKA